jgi:hypothetical protein
MRPAKLALAVICLMIATAVPPLSAASSAPDSTADALSSYLHDHRLPLVEARLMTDALGFRTLVLYGFVATDFGRSDAEAQSRRFLKDAEIMIDNRIKVRPELLHPETASPPTAVANDGGSGEPQRASGPTDDESAPPADVEAGEALGDIQAYEDQEENELQVGAPFVQPIPLIALGVIPLAPMGPPAWNYPLFAPPAVFYRYPASPFAPAPWMARRTYPTMPLTGPISTTTVFMPPFTPNRIMPLPGVLPPNYVAPPVSYAPMGGMQYFHNGLGAGGFGFVGGFHR